MIPLSLRQHFFDSTRDCDAGKNKIAQKKLPLLWHSNGVSMQTKPKSKEDEKKKQFSFTH